MTSTQVPGIIHIGTGTQSRAATLYRDGHVTYVTSRGRQPVPASSDEATTFTPGGAIYREILDEAHAEAAAEDRARTNVAPRVAVLGSVRYAGAVVRSERVGDVVRTLGGMNWAPEIAATFTPDAVTIPDADELDDAAAACAHPAAARRFHYRGGERHEWCHGCGDELGVEAVPAPEMTIITIDGAALADLREALREPAADSLRTLRVAVDVDGIKIKLNEYVWSPPYPLGPEQAARRY